MSESAKSETMRHIKLEKGADGVAILTWGQPRVLSKEQVGTMAERFKAWTATVDATAAAMEARAPELFVQ